MRLRGLIEPELAALAEALPGYELIEVIGRGAFAVVYGARHVRLSREVAIKRLSPDLLTDRDARERFAAEARLLASLDHPHIVRVHDYVESENACALVMERLRGGTLADRAEVSSFSPAAACTIVLGALHGLEHAHQRGALHRDIKPENLLFGSGDLVKVADFGIAKMIRAQGARLTATAGTIGTPAYMAPEQVKRSVGPLSAATDVWALGAVLYELLSGYRPYPQAELAETLFARISTDPLPLTEAPEVPARIAETVMRALVRDPQRRYQSASDFATALEQAAIQDLGDRALDEIHVPVHRTAPTARAGREPTIVVGASEEVAAPSLPSHYQLNGFSSSLRPFQLGWTGGHRDFPSLTMPWGDWHPIARIGQVLGTGSRQPLKSIARSATVRDWRGRWQVWRGWQATKAASMRLGAALRKSCRWSGISTRAR